MIITFIVYLVGLRTYTAFELNYEKPLYLNKLFSTLKKKSEW